MWELSESLCKAQIIPNQHLILKHIKRLSLLQERRQQYHHKVMSTTEHKALFTPGSLEEWK